jgi:hypothetical protein
LLKKWWLMKMKVHSIILPSFSSITIFYSMGKWGRSLPVSSSLSSPLFYSPPIRIVMPQFLLGISFTIYSSFTSPWQIHEISLRRPNLTFT